MEPVEAIVEPVEAIDPNNFESVQQVLDFIGRDLNAPNNPTNPNTGNPCDAITALMMAVFHQQKMGMVRLSINVMRDVVPDGDVLLVVPDNVHHQGPGERFSQVSEMITFALPVMFERLLASSLYMMKDPRECFPLDQSRFMGERWGDITKLAILANRKNSHKIVYTYDSNTYLAHFYLEDNDSFSFIICHSTDRML